MQYKLIKTILLLIVGLGAAFSVDAARLTPSTRSSSLPTTAGAQSTSVSIPASTSTAFIAFYFGAGASNQAPTSVSLDGQTATKRVSIEIAGSIMIAVYSVTGVSTGAGKTLAWTNPIGYTVLDGGIEYRDQALTYGATDSDTCSACGTLTTIALANTSGDEILCGYVANGGTLNSVGAGQTILDDTIGSDDYGFTTKTGSGGTTTSSFTYSAGGLDAYACLVASSVSGIKINPLDGPVKLFRSAR